MPSNDPKIPTHQTSGLQKTPAPLLHEIQTVLDAVAHDPAINNRANYYSYREKYDRQKGKGSLDALVATLPKVSSESESRIKEQFIHNKTFGHAASLAETLPLYANAPGRLGDYIKVKVTKTAKLDDQGGSFIDLVIELENEWIANGAPSELQDVPAKMTFLVDITTRSSADEAYMHKIMSLRNRFLLYGEKAKVLCYENKYGELGIERPKLVVEESASFLEQVGSTLGSCITQSSADKFTINAPRKFDEEYRRYFSDLMRAIGENARANAAYIGTLSDDNEKRARLKAEYEKIASFVSVYEKTPIARPRTPVQGPSRE